MNFRISGLPAETFAGYFGMSDVELAGHGARRTLADAKPGYPCRISLTDAEIGDEVLLINHEHLPVSSPYRSRHAIYVRAGERQFDAINDVPVMLRTRLLSVRGFDDAGLMTAADVVDGGQLESVVAEMLGSSRTAYLHVHFAKPGCYAARIDRA